MTINTNTNFEVITNNYKFVVNHKKMKSGNEIFEILNGQNKVLSLFEKVKEDPDVKIWLGNLICSLPNNITSQMGLDMYKITEYVANGKEKYQDYKLFKEDYEGKKLPDQFYKEWYHFMEKYGFRGGEKEIDAKNPRYYELPDNILNQIHSLLINTSPEKNPIKMFAEAEIQRKISHDNLMKIAEKEGFAREFEKAFQLMYTLGGHREIMKYHAIKLISYMRQLYMEFGEKLTSQGLLTSQNQVFDLTFNNIIDIESGVLKPSFNEIQSIIKDNLKTNNIYLKWAHNPPIIDSRGRILTVKKAPLKHGELEGQSVSLGKVTGKVKVLLSTTEKPFLPGEILVTKATDPLIINAGGILLEVGGMLQHGALVSREFGKHSRGNQ